MNKIICCGDTHFRIDSPFFEASKGFMNWFANQEFNNKDNYLIHLGDVYHESKPNPKVIKEVENWFLNKLKFKKMFILAGNHGYNRDRKSYSIEPLVNFGNIELLKYPRIFHIENLKILALPYYYPYTLTDTPPMEKHYSDLPEILRVGTDFIITHCEDETSHFNDNYCDLSYLKGEKIAGHIHIPSGHFLGSAFISRYDEKEKDNVLKIIDIKTKSSEKIIIPRFIDYYDVEYPNPLPDTEAIYSIWDIHNVPNKESALEQYPNIFHREMFKKQTRKKLKRKIKSSSKKSILEYFKEFIQLNSSIDNKLQNKLLELINDRPL